MLISIKKAAKLMLAAVCCGLGLEAGAQNVAATGAFVANPVPETASGTNNCVTMGTTSSTPITLTFTFPTTSNVQLSDVSWTVEGATGDYSLVSGYPQGTTGTATVSPAAAGSIFQVRPTGKGKMRVVLTYTVDGPCVSRTFTCAPNPSQTILVPSRTVTRRTFDFYKQFPSTSAEIDGPTCLGPGNKTVVFAVKNRPISTRQQIDAGIGTDTYSWTVTGPAGTVSTQDVGDGSTVTVTNPTAPNQFLPAGLYNISVKIGRCNTATSALPVTVAGNLFASSNIVGFPTCRAIGASGTSTTFTLATTTGVQYSLAASGGLSVSPTSIASTTGSGNQTITISGITATNSGNVIITGAGTGSSCFGTQTTVLTMNRTLVNATTNAITPICVAKNATNVGIAMANAPVGQNVTYTVSGTGWSFVGGGTTTTNSTGTVAVNTGGVDGTITATAVLSNGVSCTNPQVSQLVKVQSDLGCSWTMDLSDQAAGQYSMLSSNPTTCTPNRTQDPGVWYYFTVTPPGGGTGVTYQRASRFFTNPDMSGTALAAGSTISATVIAPATCLSGGTPVAQLRVTSGGGSQPMPAPANQRIDKSREDVVAYPNPADGLMQVDIARVVRGDAHLILRDVTGRTVLEQKVSAGSAALNTQALPQGLYTLQVVLPSGNVYKQAVSITH